MTPTAFPSLLLYRLVSRGLYLLALPPLIMAARLKGYQRDSLSGRRGSYQLNLGTQTPRIWLHGASVGEVQAIRAVIPHLQELLPQAQLLVSTMTETGQAVAQEQLGDKVNCFYAPLDAPGPVRRALTAMRPDIYVAVETELWPCLLFAAHDQGVRLALINGRISARSHRHYGLIRHLMTPLLQLFSAMCCISEVDRQRFQELAARDDLQVCGNVKYDMPQLEQEAEGSGDYLRRLQLTAHQPVLVIGSSHGNEEEKFLQLLPQLQQTVPGLVTIIAPRHLQRLPEVETLCHQAGQPFCHLSSCQGQRPADLVLVDTMGELANLYGVATVIFCGGSLVNKGGHNIFEGAIKAKPVLYGPHMDDFRDACQLLEPGGGVIEVNNYQKCGREIISLLQAPEQGLEMGQANLAIAKRQQGAARRQAEMIAQLL